MQLHPLFDRFSLPGMTAILNDLMDYGRNGKFFSAFLCAPCFEAICFKSSLQTGMQLAYFSKDSSKKILKTK
jgi:hypothetical protein